MENGTAGMGSRMLRPLRLVGMGLGYVCLAVFGSLWLLLGLALEHRPHTRL